MYFVARMDLSCALDWHLDLMPTIQYLKFKPLTKIATSCFTFSAKNDSFTNAWMICFISISISLQSLDSWSFCLAHCLMQTQNKAVSWLRGFSVNNLQLWTTKRKNERYIVYGLLCLDNTLMTQEQVGRNRCFIDSETADLQHWWIVICKISAICADRSLNSLDGDKNDASFFF